MPRHHLRIWKIPTSPTALVAAIRRMGIPHLIQISRDIEVLFESQKITLEDRRARLVSLYKMSRRAK